MGDSTHDETGETKITQQQTLDELYEQLVKATDLIDSLAAFGNLCKGLDINPNNYKTVFSLVKTKLQVWRSQALLTKLEKKSKHVEYKNKPCARNKVLVIGGGPCGLRVAIEAAFLGAHVCVVEKRDSFSRNNVLHLWPFLIVDLKSIGVKAFFGKFCAGSLDHINIRRLQVILLKICLILGVQVYPNCLFQELIEPSEGNGWRGKFLPASSPLNSFEFDCIIGCDGKRSTLPGFLRKEFRGKLAIGITCNFVNRNTTADAKVEEISGVALIYNQEFFQKLQDRTGVELENIVYYKDETHYFVMTAKKKSLLQKGVIKQDSKDAFKLLSAENVDHNGLLQFAREAADFSTNYQLPSLDFATNHYGKEDVAMFDFTSIHQAENSSRIIERRGKRLLLCIAGDTLLEPFWPTGSGLARGFLGVFDAAWMLRGFGMGRESLDLLQERESIYRLLAQTKPDSLIQDFERHSINPTTRYSCVNPRVLSKELVRKYLDMSETPIHMIDYSQGNDKEPSKISKPIRVKSKPPVTGVDAATLLSWCREQTKGYKGVQINDMSTSWRSGLAFAAVIHRYRPDLLDFSLLEAENAEYNCDLAFSLAEEHLGISPKVSGRDLAAQTSPDPLAIISYMSLVYETLRHQLPVSTELAIPKAGAGEGSPLKSPPKSPSSKMSIISRLSRRTQKSEKIRDKQKSKLGRRSRADKENKLVLASEANIALTSYKVEKIAEGNPLLSTGDANRKVVAGSLDRRLDPPSRTQGQPMDPSFQGTPIDLSRLVSKTPELVRKPVEERLGRVKFESPPSVARSGGSSNVPATDPVSSVERNGILPDGGSDRRHKNRISQLAADVFGDTVVSVAPRKDSVGAVPSGGPNKENLSESERCYFCGRHVYVIERMSAEGLFFHRKCFRCCVCKCHLLPGSYAFDADDDEDALGGKFYCKMHYNQMKYKSEEKAEQQVQTLAKRDRRPMTQIVNPNELDKAFAVMTLSKVLRPLSVADAVGAKGIPASIISSAASTSVAASEPVQLKSRKSSFTVMEISSEPDDVAVGSPVVSTESDSPETSKKAKSPKILKKIGNAKRSAGGAREENAAKPRKVAVNHQVHSKGERGKGSVASDEAVEKTKEQGRYDKFEARPLSNPSSSLMARHPSLKSCSPQFGQVANESIKPEAARLSSDSTLSKLIKEDPMFANQRQGQSDRTNAEYLTRRSKASQDLTDTIYGMIAGAPGQEAPSQSTAPSRSSGRRKLSVPADLRQTLELTEQTTDALSRRDAYGSPDYGDRNVSLAGAVGRRPAEERRAQYPISMAFSESVVAAGLHKLVVDMDTNADKLHADEQPVLHEKTDGVVQPAKKRKLVLKKRKKAKTDRLSVHEELSERELPTISTTDTDGFAPVAFPGPSTVDSDTPTRRNGETVEGPWAQTALREHSDASARGLGTDWVILDDQGDVVPAPVSDSMDSDYSTSSCEEELGETSKSAKNKGFFRRAFGRTSKKKRRAAREKELMEKRQKRRQLHQIVRQMKQREVKRLWLAQSIQRKLNEVEVQQYDLDERARIVEEKLKQKTNKGEDTSLLMLSWFQLVNDKNMLLRFESELVIEANSIQLEDRQARLEHQIRELLLNDRTSLKSQNQIESLTKELVDTVEERNALVQMLEEDRIRELEEDKNLKEVLAKKSHDLGLDRLV